MSACPSCGYTHVAGDAVALSRFAGVTGFRTADGAIHFTREDAQEWLCEQRQERPVSPVAQQTTCEDHSRCCTYLLCAHPKCCGYALPSNPPAATEAARWADIENNSGRIGGERDE